MDLTEGQMVGLNVGGRKFTWRCFVKAAFSVGRKRSGGGKVRRVKVVLGVEKLIDV